MTTMARTPEILVDKSIKTNSIPAYAFSLNNFIGIFCRRLFGFSPSGLNAYNREEGGFSVGVTL